MFFGVFCISFSNRVSFYVVLVFLFFFTSTISRCVVLKSYFTVMLNVISGANKFPKWNIVPAVVGRYCATDRRVCVGFSPPELMLTGRICTHAASFVGISSQPQPWKLDVNLSPLTQKYKCRPMNRPRSPLMQLSGRRIGLATSN